MLKKQFFVIPILFFVCQSYAQELKGVFSLAVNNQSYYVNFKDSSFELFSLQDNPKPENKPRFILNEIGNGTYIKSRNNLLLKFDSVIAHYNFYITDSLESKMKTNSSHKNKIFDINVKYNFPEFKNSYLVIEGYLKDYRIPIKDGKLITEFPDSINIKTIYLSIMAYGKRELPYLHHFNTFKYNYFLNDSYPPIIPINNKIWNFSIVSQNQNINFKFNENNNYLNKVNKKTIDYLKSISIEDSQINKVTEQWFDEN